MKSFLSDLYMILFTQMTCSTIAKKGVKLLIFHIYHCKRNEMEFGSLLQFSRASSSRAQGNELNENFLTQYIKLRYPIFLESYLALLSMGLKEPILI